MAFATLVKYVIIHIHACVAYLYLELIFKFDDKDSAKDNEENVEEGKEEIVEKKEQIRGIMHKIIIASMCILY